MKEKEDIVLLCRKIDKRLEDKKTTVSDSNLIFAGFCIESIEGWNDYKINFLKDKYSDSEIVLNGNKLFIYI